MSNYSELFDKDLIFLQVEANDRNDLYQKVADKLAEQGLVKESFLPALIKREDEFPTGVITQYLPIVLPHANPENVNQPFIAVVQTQNEIRVQQMGTNEDELARNFFFLGIVKETQDLQVKLLQRFMQLMNNQEFVMDFKKIDKPADMYDYLINNF
ncbi:galactitol-specific PTS system IIA component [Ligilactobacillus salitolerans]|uniref:Galactitol-specific PTS system IIA component n=1 Tax=Ligilactobacillus salitolerans TaxID=1808352 RepID=A0A401IVX0_9LACO|nr:PTS sugar transporter subunit IIA [Ligilactobacillus salitolerans]GBG95690.1 galactitol-specific PTS system IIA component [Ligilactobacillus salitolerans]